MYECVLIAFVGAIINMILALLIPCLLKDTQAPLFVNIKKVYATHKQVIITSSVIVFITIYLALKVTPQLGLSFENDQPVRNTTNFDNIFNSLPDSNRVRLINLSRL